MRRDNAGKAKDAASVLCVVPCLNEAQHLDRLIATLLADADQIAFRLVVVDGGSTDGSQAIIRRHMELDPRLTLEENPKRVQSAAMNKAVELYGDDAEFLIRVDAHCEYPARYCERLLAVQSETGADCVVVSMRAEGQGCFQVAAAVAQNSVLGNGGTAHRNDTTGAFVDHGHHALMRIAAYKAVGGYDESFFWNEDAELDVRMRASGFRIYLAGGMPIIYFPRRSPVALFRQYVNYGRGRARNFLKHHERLRLRQVLPIAVAPAVVIALLAPVSPVFAVPAVTWMGCCLVFGAYLGLRAGKPCAALAGFAAMAMHLGWSIGFLLGVFNQKVRATRVARGVDAPVAS